MSDYQHSAYLQRNKSNPFNSHTPAVDRMALGVQNLGDVSTVSKRDSLGRVVMKQESESETADPARMRL